MFVANLPFLGSSLLIVLMTTVGIFAGQINLCQAIVFYIIGLGELLKRVAQVIKVNTVAEEPQQTNIPPPDFSELMGMFGNLPMPEEGADDE